jgi:hypothetical protein
MLSIDNKSSIAHGLPACLRMLQGSKFKVQGFWAVQNQISVNQPNPCHVRSIKKGRNEQYNMFLFLAQPCIAP